ncbi:helix-turn-helix domain-containing protein [Legionella bononiensis]|uniref:AraC family transcriptional regulator n=1 Tax=Legionella bononiensis TaxID=2793102 RepID=A0ABS1W6R7_9GAMM|nr:helix-turn-helix domain-containing protein [Legionella bononiensis]MBL7478423.1 AraC family transcriptional regulator [Legionella bononiensis]MBL7525020.1 AraC family transcriptional regulator [Legionella bononiensis]MBL7561317.1 AraC family transcriptional regulator [Legionella bononiensis]
MHVLPISNILNPVLFSLVKSIGIDSKEEQTDIQPYRVMPDCYVVMGFQYTGSLLLLQESQQIKLGRCGISGLQTKYKEYKHSTNDTKTLLITFYPWAVPILFNECASALTNQALNLSDIFGTTLQDILEEQLLSLHTIEDIVPALEVFFSGLNTNKNKRVDEHFIKQMKQIMNLCVTSSVNHLATDLGYTNRTLERRFKDYVGISPQKFLLLKRFQTTLMHLRNGKNWEEIMEFSNYYDQAHFIHEYKAFSGLTPTQIK